MAATRPVHTIIDADDLDRLRFIARRRGIELAELIAYLLRSWLDGPGRPELLDALTPAKPRRTRPRSEPARRARRRPAAPAVPVGQMVIDDVPPF